MATEPNGSEALDGQGQPPASPKFAPLASASLFPPPPPTHQFFTPVNQWLYQVLKEHDERKEQLQDEAAGPSDRIRAQRNILLEHALPKLREAPHDVKRFLRPSSDNDRDDEQDAEIATASLEASLREHILDLPIDLRLEMDPPDLHVIKDELKGYHVYGQWWPLPPAMTGLEEAGIRRLYNEADHDAQGRLDRRPSLLLLLRSWLSTYLSLLSLLQYPPSYYTVRTLHRNTSGFDPSGAPLPPEAAAAAAGGEPQEFETVDWITTASSHWSHMRTLVLNFQEVLNRSRRNQAARNVRAVLAQQVQHRRDQTEMIQQQNAKVKALIQSMMNGGSQEAAQRGPSDDVTSHKQTSNGPAPQASQPLAPALPPPTITVKMEEQDRPLSPKVEDRMELD